MPIAGSLPAALCSESGTWRETTAQRRAEPPDRRVPEPDASVLEIRLQYDCGAVHGARCSFLSPMAIIPTNRCSPVRLDSYLRARRLKLDSDLNRVRLIEQVGDLLWSDVSHSFEKEVYFRPGIPQLDEYRVDG
jgi:hypothetical protein